MHFEDSAGFALDRFEGLAVILASADDSFF
jgi:hypothetical protein